MLIQQTHLAVASLRLALSTSHMPTAPLHKLPTTSPSCKTLVQSHRIGNRGGLRVSSSSTAKPSPPARGWKYASSASACCRPNKLDTLSRTQPMSESMNPTTGANSSSAIAFMLSLAANSHQTTNTVVSSPTTCTSNVQASRECIKDSTASDAAIDCKQHISELAGCS